MIFGHNTLYFDNPERDAAAEGVRAWYEDKYKDYPNWEADRAYFAMQVYKAGVEAAAQGEERPGRPGRRHQRDGRRQGRVARRPGPWRKDHIAEQTFYQGLTTHKNKLRLRDARPGRSRRCTPTSCRSRPGPTSGSGSRRRRSRSEPVCDRTMSRSSTSCSAAFFTPPFCFWSPPGCSSCSACRRSSTWRAVRSTRSAPTSASRWSIGALNAGLPPWMLAAGADRRRRAAGGDRPADRAAAAHRLRARRELPAAAHVRAGADVPGRAALHLGRQSAAARQRACWSTARSRSGDFSVPIYNLLVIARRARRSRVMIGLFLQRTNYGRILRATAENRDDGRGARRERALDLRRACSRSARCSARSAARWWSRPRRRRSTCRSSSWSRRSRWW